MMRPPVPRSVEIAHAKPGQVGSASAGGYLTVNTVVTARVEGPDAALFSVARIATYDVETETETRPPRQVLVPALSVSGAGPIDAFVDEAIIVTVDFACPADPAKADFQATALLKDAASSVVMAVPLAAHALLGSLSASVEGSPAMQPGTTTTITFDVSSTVGHPVPIAFRYNPTFEPLFSAPTQFPSPVPSNGNVRFDVPVSCSTLVQGGTSHLLQFQILSADQSQVLGSIAFDVSVPLPPPPPHVPVDPSIVWEVATDLALSVDPAANSWHAGRLKDILLRADGIFVAASTGGVWGIDPNDPNAGAGNTSDDVDNPNFNCLAFGPDSPLQIYGGCATLASGAAPGAGLYLRGLSNWRPVPILDAFGITVLTDDILRIVVLRSHRTLVLATQRGVFVSPIPGQGVQRHTFVPANGLPPGPYSGLCEGPGESVIASLWGPSGGIFVGEWTAGLLTFTMARLISDPSNPFGTIDPTQMTRSSVAACDADLSTMYAVSAGLDNRIYRILRSSDGGKTWRPLRNLASGVHRPGKLAPLAPDNASNDFAGSTGWYTNCIGVGTHNSNIVGIGWANGPWLTSDASDVLSRWELAYEQSNSSHVHGDIQAIRFDPAVPSDNSVWVASDGGLTYSYDRAGPAGYHSHLNRHLCNLQFYLNTSPLNNGLLGFAGGGICASSTAPGLIAGPTQDNGNLFCDLESAQTRAWRALDGGDGVTMRFLTNGLLLWVAPGDSNPPRRARLARWDGNGFVDRHEVPVTSPTMSALSVYGDMQPVAHPSFELPGTLKLLHALASTANAGGALINVYGLFTDGSIEQAEWQLIATLPLARGDAISSVASFNGHQVFAGTAQGRVFSLAPFQKPFELAVSPVDKGPVHDIIVVRDALAFALYDGPRTKAILQSEFFNWDPLGSNENVARGQFLDGTEQFTGLVVDRQTVPITLYASTDTRVWVSRDEGNTWLLATRQLPRRAHGSSLAIGAARSGGGRFLYLGTYGRSVWQARI